MQTITFTQGRLFRGANFVVTGSGVQALE